MPAMNRGMSYRKPVPAFIPSPPPSPLVASTDIAEGYNKEEEEGVPPLPENWREILNARILESKSSRLSLVARTVLQVNGDWQESDITEVAFLPEDPNADSRARPSSLQEDQESVTVASSCGTTPFDAFKQPSRGLPTQYRPPTPPLPSHNRRHSGRPVEAGQTFEDATWPFAQKIEEPRAYPPGLYSNGFYAPTGAPSIRPIPSFHTENTMHSMSTAPFGNKWARSFGTLPDGGMYNHRALYKKERALDASSLSDAVPDSAGGTFCCSGFNSSFDFFNRALRNLATCSWTSK